MSQVEATERFTTNQDDRIAGSVAEKRAAKPDHGRVGCAREGRLPCAEETTRQEENHKGREQRLSDPVR